jgi:hypothetical protein
MPRHPQRIPRPAADLHAIEASMRWIARLAFTLALMGLVAWWLVVMLDRSFELFVMLAAVATLALLIRLARLDARARRLR